MPKKRTSYNIGQTEPYKISRNAIENFIRCPRCSVLDRREGIAPPSGPPFTLNTAVDALFKIESDHYRELQQPLPIALEYGINLVPLQHEKIDDWRENFKGVRHHHPETNFLISGAVDDIWVDSNGTLTVIDYKSTSKNGRVEELGDAQYQHGYRRQLSIYTWLLRQNGFEVTDKAYWVYANGLKEATSFDATLKFDLTMIEYQTTTDFIEPTLLAFKQALDTETLPPAAADCEMCAFFEERKAND